MKRSNHQKSPSAHGHAVALLLFVLSFIAVGCDKCIHMDCQSMPAASLTPSGLRASGVGSGFRIEATTLDIPVTKDVKVCAAYELLSKDVTLEGAALLVMVNRQQALAVEFKDEGGL